MAYAELRQVPYSLYRGGTSKGVILDRIHVPTDSDLGEFLVRLIGPDARQIDGLGGGHPLTSKVAIVNKSTIPGADIDYYFVQVSPGKGTISDKQPCGNVLFAVGQYAIEKGMVGTVNDGKTVVNVYMVNNKSIVQLEIETPGGRVNYFGNQVISGVPGTGSPIKQMASGLEGLMCKSLFPTGKYQDMTSSLP